MKFLLWNLENFFLVSHLKASYNQALKPEKKVREIAGILTETAADIIFLCEVGGLDSLIKLNQRLENNYDCFYTEGNSDRGIGLGFLVKKNSYNVKFRTHADDLLPPITLEDRKNPRKFSRDAAELWICNEHDTPKLIIWGVHLKSGQDRSGNDFRGFRQRSAEVRGLVTLIKSRQLKYPEVQQWIAGDFNGKAYGPKIDSEFEHLAAHLTTHHDILERLDTPLEQRWTFAMGNKGASELPSQLDYLFIPDTTPTPEAENSGIMHLWQRLGFNAGPALTTGQRELWPSDHLPILASWSKSPF